MAADFHIIGFFLVRTESARRFLLHFFIGKTIYGWVTLGFIMKSHGFDPESLALIIEVDKIDLMYLTLGHLRLRGR